MQEKDRGARARVCARAKVIIIFLKSFFTLIFGYCATDEDIFFFLAQLWEHAYLNIFISVQGLCVGGQVISTGTFVCACICTSLGVPHFQMDIACLWRIDAAY